MPDKTVGDLMHKGIIACRPDTPMTEVVRIVLDTDVHAIVVVDDDSQALGLISDLDIVRLYGTDLSRHTAREVMSDGVHEIEPDQPARLAAARMLEKGVQRLLVYERIDGQARPVGIISATDLVKGMRGARWTWHIG
jgi:predicted transcriptional regulator